MPAALSTGGQAECAAVRVSAKTDYAVRAMIELAAGPEDGPVKGELISEAQGIPLHFLENILSELRLQDLVHSRRGADGGYWLAKPAAEITVADIVRAIEGPLANVRGELPQDIPYEGRAQPLKPVWIALRANVRGVLESVTLADLATGNLPDLPTDAAG
jgi:Rrf2 family protein